MIKFYFFSFNSEFFEMFIAEHNFEINIYVLSEVNWMNFNLELLLQFSLFSVGFNCLNNASHCISQLLFSYFYFCLVFS